jgi:hypothetical protein
MKMNFEEIKPIKGFHSVKFFRRIKREISRKMSTMTWEERWAYLAEAPDIFARKPGTKKGS